MCSLAAFPRPPPAGVVTICERDGRLVVGSEAEAARFLAEHLSNYLKVAANQDTLRPYVSRESAKNAFLQHHDSVWKQAVSAWHEQGYFGFLQELSKNQQASGVYYWLSLAAKSAVSLMWWIQSLRGSLYPHLLLPIEEMCSLFSQSSDWQNGHIRAFAWHPQTVKFAFASHNDIIKVYTTGAQTIPLLKHKFQKNVTELAWKPYCASVLAVACQRGILLWQIEPTSLMTRPSSSCATVLTYNGHTPVTSIAWHPDGSLLASASASDISMLIWNVAMETCVPMKRVGGGGVSLVKWSPQGHRLMAATPSTLFRIWETNTWTCEKWSQLLSRCVASCWSPDGRYLLFALSGIPKVYSLSFCPAEDIKPYCVGGSEKAVPVIDLGGLEDLQEFVKTGGCVQDMIWDKHGERLVISFKDNKNFVAVFRTRIKPFLEINPCGYLKGGAAEYPQLISFCDEFENGSLLTVCWSSGVISHIPFYYHPISRAMSESYSMLGN